MSRLSTASSTARPPESRAAPVATSTHMSSGAGAPSSPTTSGCHVCVATPMMHGLRGSMVVIACAGPAGGGSLALPVRLPLLGERLRTLLRVFGLEDRAREATLLLERGAQLLAEHLEDLRGRRDGCCGRC